jgi:hypothetical protein
MAHKYLTILQVAHIKLNNHQKSGKALSQVTHHSYKHYERKRSGLDDSEKSLSFIP